MKIRATKSGKIGAVRIRRDNEAEISDKDFNPNWMVQIAKPKESKKKVKKEKVEEPVKTDSYDGDIIQGQVMALDTYSNLKASVRRSAIRNDFVDDDLDEYIALCEAEIYANPDHPLRIRDMEKRATASTSIVDRFLALPDNFVHMRQFKVTRTNASPCDITFLAPEQLQVIDRAGMPTFFTVTSQLEFDRTSDIAYTVEMQYFAKLTGLSSSNTTNAILTNFPAIYKNGVLYQLFLDKKDDNEAAKYQRLFLTAIAGANTQDRNGRYGSAPKIRIEGSTP